MSNRVLKIELDAKDRLTNIDQGWLMRLINEKMSSKSLLDYERQELVDLQVKLYALDTATTVAGWK